MKILEKVQNLPEGKRKIIFWSVIIVIGIASLFIYFKSIQSHIRNFESINLKEKLKLPDLKAQLDNLPKLEIPQPSEEELKQMEEELKKINEFDSTSSAAEIKEENQTTTDEQTKATTSE